jgi:colicin import membrane protein
MPFSPPGLVGQLEYEGCSTLDADWAVSQLGIDWDIQAALAAQRYVDAMPFSRQGLIEQLMYEGFTYEQGVYAVDSLELNG